MQDAPTDPKLVEAFSPPPVDASQIDQLTALTFSMTAAQVFLKSMHPANRRAFLKEPQNILRLVFSQFARQLGGSDEGARALIEEMRRRGF